MVATYCLQFAIKNKVVEEEEVVEKKTLSLPISAKRQCAIWDNTTLVELFNILTEVCILEHTICSHGRDSSARRGSFPRCAVNHIVCLPVLPTPVRK